jgi:peptidyl-prolyl cis-trans isomerase SurA
MRLCSRPLKGRLYPIFYLFIFSINLLAVLAWAEDDVVVDRIVAVVNDELISLYDLNQSLEPFARKVKDLGYSAEKEREMLFQVRTDLLRQLVDAKLVDQEIKKNKLTVAEGEIDRAIERIKAARHYTDEDMRAGLAEQGLTMEDYRKEIKEQLLRSKLVNLEVKSKIVITEKNIQEYYERHREKYAGERKYHLWNIFISADSAADGSNQETALNKMESILAKLKQGVPFESLAEDSNISSLGARGGDLGMYLPSELSEQLRDVVGKMKAGEFSSILNTGNGYQIVYVQKIIETEAKSMSEVATEIHDILYREMVDSRYQVWLDDLRERSHIKIIN